MNEREIIREAMKTVHWSQEELAKQSGYGNQSSVSSLLNRSSMKVDTLVKFLSTMGYRLVVESTSPNTNKNRWEITRDKEVK